MMGSMAIKRFLEAVPRGLKPGAFRAVYVRASARTLRRHILFHGAFLSGWLAQKRATLAGDYFDAWVGGEAFFGAGRQPGTDAVVAAEGVAAGEDETVDFHLFIFVDPAR